MRILFGVIVLLIIPLLTSCSNCKVTKEEEKNQVQQNPTTVTPNLSVVTAQVDEVLFKDETDYQIKVTLLEVKETEAFPSIAVRGDEYILIPNFRYDNEIMIENDVNTSLKMLSRVSANKKFKAEISFEYPKGWFIQKVLSVE